MKPWTWLAVGAAACTTTAPPTAPAAHLAVEQEQARRYIITVAPGTDPSAIARDHGLTPSHVYRYALNGFAADVPEAALEGLRRNPQVVSISPSNVVQTFTVSSWGLDRINQRDRPLDGIYSAPNTGAGVTIYVTDTGILEHPELAGRVGSGWDFIDNDPDASDCHGHGTHVAGTVAGTTIGVATRATIIAVRMLDCSGSGTTEQAVAAVDWIITHVHRPAVINASWGVGAIDPALDAAVASATAAGIVWASAAGNSNADACTFSPARSPSGMAVGSTDANDARSSFSNWGSCVDLFAPGRDILSLSFLGGYTAKSGTSMASPHVAGVAALYLAANPLATPAAVTQALTVGASSNRLTLIGVGSPNLLLFNGVAGAGVLPELPPPANPVHPVPAFIAPVHVTDLDAMPYIERGGWVAAVEVEARDGAGVLVYLYGVEMRFTDGFTEVCNLDFNGRCTVRRHLKNSSKQVTATMVRIGNPSLYNAAYNTDPDGDSNGTTILIRKP